MTEQSRHIADSTDAPTRAGQPRHEAAEAAEQRRELILMISGAHAFAVYADEADGVTRGLKPTPLPGAPRAVAGVVCVRGRMRTVLDPLALLSPTGEPDEEEDASIVEASASATSPFIVTLRGDEQLALAVERVSSIVELPTDALRGDAQSASGGGVVRGTLQHDGQHIILLDPSNMFEAAMRGTERRRQRLKAVNREP